MGPQNFEQAFGFYYRQILDLTYYLAFFFLSAGLCILLWPKERNLKNILKLVLVLIVSYGVCILFSSLMFSISVEMHNQVVSQIFFALTLPIVILAFSAIFMRKGRGIHWIIKSIILISSIAVVEVLSKNTGFFFGKVSNDIFVVVALARSLPFALFTFVCFLLYKVDIVRYRNLSNEMIIIISVLSALLIVASIYEQATTTQETATVALLSILDIVLLFILNFSYYATYKNIEHRHRITNLEVQKTLEDAERMSIAIDQTNREELEKLRHDIKNQFSYLDVMLQQGQNDEAKKYVEDYLNNSNPVLHSFSCSNKVINSIINLELTKAKIKKIKIDVKVVVPPALPFKDIDLVSLLTNMIDNALENYYSENKEPITVRIMKQNDFIRIIVSNPINVEKVNLRALTKTSKVGRGHGYGTKIIKNIANAYKGGVDFSVEDNRFICDAILNLNVEEQADD
ncbi:MAG: GHKL domain-containing protein [Bacilli bacterium]|nr:GHKL domain-containing protein [Bacilli bacterium]